MFVHEEGPIITLQMPTRRPKSPLRPLKWLVVSLFWLLVAAVGAAWVFGPAWIAPLKDFPASPGGAVAYISLATQLRQQGTQIATGKDFTVEMNEEEFTGLLTSVLMSNKQPTNPLDKVHAALLPDLLQIEGVLRLPYEQIPARFQGPIGLELWLRPHLEQGGQVRLQVIRAALGRVPVPLQWIRWVGQRYPVAIPGYDPNEISISLPMADLMRQQVGRPVKVKGFRADTDKLTMTLALP